MADHNVSELLDAFDHSYDSEPSDAILKVMAFIRDNTGLLGDYNPGKARLNTSGTTVMVTSRERRFSSHSPLLSWLNEQDDVEITYIGVKSMSGGEKHPHVEIKEV